MSILRRFAGRRVTFWQAVLMALLALGLYATVLRYAKGLGAVTHLSDAFPWGLWVGFDVLVGVGLAAGGFVIAATVHVFRLRRYEEIARPAILTAFLGYLLVVVALLLDLGLPHRIWHPLVMWNAHSVMFEVSWCVTLYTTVLFLEFLPLVLERFGWRRPLSIIHRVYVPIVIAGVLLSTLHQSSLGTFYVIAPEKLYGLWYTTMLPVFFFISAVAGGLAMTIFESYMSHRAFGKHLESDLLQNLGRIAVVVLGVYALWKTLDLASRGALHLVFQLTPESVMFWGEMGLGVLLPMLLFAVPAVRRNQHGLFFAALLTVMGFILNRLNVAITGMARSSGVAYFPSWYEFAVTAAIVGAGFLAFALAVKYLPVFPKPEGEVHGGDPVPATVPRPVMNRPVLASLWVLLLIGGVTLGFTTVRAGREAAAAAQPVPQPAVTVPVSLDRLPADFTFPTSAESPGPVTFSHAGHVDAGDARCATCHVALFRINEAGRPVSGELTFERIHQGDLCASCHDGENAFAVEDDCSLCHAM